MAATAQMNFESEAGLSSSFWHYRADLYATIWTLYGHWWLGPSITSSVLLIMPHGDKGRFLELTLQYLYPVLSWFDDTFIPFADFSC